MDWRFLVQAQTGPCDALGGHSLRFTSHHCSWSYWVGLSHRFSDFGEAFALLLKGGHGTQSKPVSALPLAVVIGSAMSHDPGQCSLGHWFQAELRFGRMSCWPELPGASDFQGTWPKPGLLQGGELGVGR